LLSDLIRWGQFEAALWLLPRQHNLTVADERGWTALHQAASRGNLRMVEALITAGADPHRRDAKGATPLDIALAARKTKIVAALA
jgi:ankyrin repeat protein